MALRQHVARCACVATVDRATAVWSPTCAPRSAAIAVARRATRARALRPGRVDRSPGAPAVVCFPTTTAEVQACVRVARRHGRPFVARGAGTGLAGGAVPARRRRSSIVTTKMDRILVGRRRGAGRLGRARRAQPRPHRARSRRSASTSPPTRRASRRARSAATWPTTPAARTAWPTASPAPTSWPWRWCCPTARSPMLGGLDPEPAGLRPARRVRRQRGHAGHRHPHRRAPHAQPAGRRARCSLDFPSVDDAAATRGGDHRRRDRPGRAGDDGRGRMTRAVEDFVHAGFPTDAAAVLLVEVDGLPGGRGRRTPTSSRRSAGPHGARTVRVAADEAERAAAVEGPQVGVRRRRPHRAELLPARHRRARAPAWSRCCARSTRSPTRHDLHRDERLPRRRRQPAPAARVRRPRAGRARAGPRRRRRDRARRRSTAGGVLSGEHGIGLEKRDFMPLLFSAGRPRRAGPAARRVRPRRRRQPGQGAARRLAGCGDLAARCRTGAWV